MNSHRSVDTRAALAQTSARAAQNTAESQAQGRNPASSAHYEEGIVAAAPTAPNDSASSNSPHSDSVDATEDPELGAERERILNQMSANWSMESEFFRSREEVMAQLRYSLDFLDALERSSRSQLERVQTRRVDLDAALRSVAEIEEENWAAESVDEECQAALRVISDARMEWRRCCLQWPELRGTSPTSSGPQLTDEKGAPVAMPPLTAPNMAYLCKLGFAFTWPLGLAVLILGVVFALTR